MCTDTKTEVGNQEDNKLNTHSGDRGVCGEGVGLKKKIASHIQVITNST